MHVGSLQVNQVETLLADSEMLMDSAAHTIFQTHGASTLARNGGSRNMSEWIVAQGCTTLRTA